MLSFFSWQPWGGYSLPKMGPGWVACQVRHQKSAFLVWGCCKIKNYLVRIIRGKLLFGWVCVFGFTKPTATASRSRQSCQCSGFRWKGIRCGHWLTFQVALCENSMPPHQVVYSSQNLPPLGPWTPSNATDANLDYVIIKNCFTQILDYKKHTETNWVSDQTWGLCSDCLWDQV